MISGANPEEFSDNEKALIQEVDPNLWEIITTNGMNPLTAIIQVLAHNAFVGKYENKRLWKVLGEFVFILMKVNIE